MSVRIGSFIAAAALAAACSSSDKETRPTATMQGTPVRESPASGSAVDIAAGVPAGTSGTTTSLNGAIEGPGGPVGAQGTASGMASSDRRSARGQVANVDPSAGRITLDQAAGTSIVIIIDDTTRFVDSSGQTMSKGMSGIHEGQQVRATMDPSSRHADEIQVTRDTGP
jgi:hypothetical protein